MPFWKIWSFVKAKMMPPSLVWCPLSHQILQPFIWIICLKCSHLWVITLPIRTRKLTVTSKSSSQVKPSGLCHYILFRFIQKPRENFPPSSLNACYEQVKLAARSEDLLSVSRPCSRQISRFRRCMYITSNIFITFNLFCSYYVNVPFLVFYSRWSIVGFWDHFPDLLNVRLEIHNFYFYFRQILYGYE